MEVKTLQEDLEKSKQEALDKEKLLQESLANKESLTQQLIDTKHIIWDHLLKEIKRLKDYFFQVEDERKLTTSCLDSMKTIQENLGDKPLQAQNAINYLNSRSKTQLQFVGVEDRRNI